MDTVKISIKLENLIQKHLVESLEKKILEIIEIIMVDYNLLLNGVDINRNSKARPELYEDEFRSLLEDLDKDFWINTSERGAGYVSFTMPSIDTLDLSNLKILELIFEGLPGKYVTVTEEQFKNANIKIGNKQLLDSNARKSDRVYLVRFNDSLRIELENILNLRKGLPVYAFSNMPGINIFETANVYFDDNIDKWIDKAIDKATNELKQQIS